MSMRPFLAAAAVVLALAAGTAPAPAAAQTRDIERTDPGHLNPPLPYLEPPPWRPRLNRPNAPESRIVYRMPFRRAELTRQGFQVDSELSRLCQRGRFRQRTDGLIRVSLPDGWVGLAFGNGRNLRDDAGVAEPGTAYLFEDQNSTACRVRAVPEGLIEQYGMFVR
jgi:hypothetical protein